ncbi:MAG: bifunctional diaminohydroxyphosphoribosylaminopyrimidine deaminase/5-amino-6-(5-phosphoribosylamino)uracil reductase RibD [Syntrophomonas sp.]
MQHIIDEYYMQRALNLAARAQGRTSPNPVVGAVLVKDGQVVGEGYHRQAGTPHAEVMALQRAKENARGATLYVTLEPCCHFGRTPPCCEAVINQGVSRVVAASLDPNPLVAGKGMARLQEAGISTVVGILQEQAVRLNEFFFKFIKEGRPFVTLKTAMTLDGKIATSTGDSRWISSEAAREYVHQLRNLYDAIMVGIGTVLADDPQLNTRLKIEEGRDPLRVILDPGLQLPLESKIVQSSREQCTLVFANRIEDPQRVKMLEEQGVEVCSLDGEGPVLDLELVLGELGRRGICSMLLEGGAEINAAMLKKRLVDKLIWVIAPKIIGGKAAPGPVAGPGRQLMSEALVLGNVQMHKLGPDFILTAYTGW